MDTILNNRLNEELRKNGNFILNNNQIGFRAGLGCEINILRLVEELRIKIKKRKNKKLWSLFIDLKSAFDTVDHEILWRKMERLGIDQNLINTIKWFYR